MKTTTIALNLKTKGGDNKMKKMVKVLLVLVAVMGILGVQSANASPILTVKDGVNPDIVISDNGFGDESLISGYIKWTQTLGIWDINLIGGFSKPIEGSVTQPGFHLGVNSHSTTAGTLEIIFEDDGFTYTGPFTTEIGGVITKGGGSALVETWINATKISSVSLPGTVSSGSYAIGLTDSLKLDTYLTHLGKGTSSYDIGLTTPEPSTLILLGSGLVGVFFAGRRMKK